MPVSREEFPQQVAAILGGKFPLVKVEQAVGEFGLVLNGNFAALENLYRLVAQQPGQMNRHVERWVVELLRAAEGRPDEEAGFEAVRERILPMLLPVRERDPVYQSAVNQPLIEGLNVAYAIDTDRTITYIPKTQFAKWQMSIDDLHETALKNLQERSNPLAVHAGQDEQGQVNLIIIQTMDGYDASRILLPTLNSQLKQYLGSPFMAAVPNRDILVCFRNDQDMINRLSSQIAQDYATMPHQITQRMFLVTPDGIAPYGE